MIHFSVEINELTRTIYLPKMDEVTHNTFLKITNEVTNVFLQNH